MNEFDDDVGRRQFNARIRELEAALRTAQRERDSIFKAWDAENEKRHDAEEERAAAEGRLAQLRVYGQWQPIETAPREEEVFFWLVPKTREEASCNTSGDPIFTTFQPYLHRGQLKSWSALSKATHWMPLPAPPSSRTPRSPNHE